MHVVNQTSLDQIRIFHLKCLMPTSILFKNLNLENLVIADGKLIQEKYILLHHISGNSSQWPIGTEWYQWSLLHDGTFSDLFVHNLEIDEINLERYIAFVLNSVWK